MARLRQFNYWFHKNYLKALSNIITISSSSGGGGAAADEGEMKARTRSSVTPSFGRRQWRLGKAFEVRSLSLIHFLQHSWEAVKEYLPFIADGVLHFPNVYSELQGISTSWWELLPWNLHYNYPLQKVHFEWSCSSKRSKIWATLTKGSDLQGTTTCHLCVTGAITYFPSAVVLFLSLPCPFLSAFFLYHSCTIVSVLKGTSFFHRISLFLSFSASFAQFLRKLKIIPLPLLLPDSLFNILCMHEHWFKTGLDILLLWCQLGFAFEVGGAGNCLLMRFSGSTIHFHQLSVQKSEAFIRNTDKKTG